MLTGVALRPSSADDPRLLQAMTASVAAHGYRQTTVANVIALAGVGRNSFYARYPNKEQCFLAAYERILASAVREATTAAAPDATSPAERVAPAMTALFALVAAEPASARAALLESAAAGEAAFRFRTQATEALAAELARSLDADAERDAPADRVLFGICGGVESFLCTRVREGRERELIGTAPAVAAWAASYTACVQTGAPTLDVPSPIPPRAPASSPTPAAPGHLAPTGPSGRRGLPPGPKREPRDFIAHNVRDRLLDAVATVAARDGYTALSVAEIVAEAQTSRRSFYEHFTTVEEAFCAALMLGAEGAMAATLVVYATRADWREAIIAGVGSFCSFMAAEPAFARVGIIESLTGGVAVLEVRDQAQAAFAALLADAYRRGDGDQPEDPVLTAALVAGAILALCADTIRREGPSTLTALAPDAAVLALVPAIGAAAATDAVAAFYVQA
jgi:AcrR family transcriptional regulator